MNDPMRALYIQCELMCQLSLLTLILRAKPTIKGLGVSEQCIAVARDSLEVHEQCMTEVRSSKNPSYMARRYINW
jgi:hypothetical protein